VPPGEKQAHSALFFEAENQGLRKQFNMQMTRFTEGLGVTLLALLWSTYSVAQTFENKQGGSVRFYGQASPSYLSFDDGEDTTANLTDNSNSNTRLGFVISQPTSGGDLVLTFETGLGFRQSVAVSQDYKPQALDWQRTALRRFEAAYTADFGTVAIGQGFMATDNVATLDASDTALVLSVGVSDASFAFRETSGELSNVRIIDAFKDFDGSRLFRIRYDTPVYAGFSAAASYGRNILAKNDNTDYYDIALRWFRTLGEFELAAAAGYASASKGLAEVDDDKSKSQRYSGSFSMLHTPTGLNLSASSGTDPDTGTYGFVRAGWKSDLIAPGPSAFAISYYDGNDLAVENSSSEGVGFAVVQAFTEHDLELYFGYRSYSYDDGAANYKDASSVFSGARYKF